MGQIMEYIASVFTIGGRSKSVDGKDGKSNHVTFAENSFSQVFGNREEQAAKMNALRQSNMKTICTYEFIVAAALLVHLTLVAWPKVQLESFNIYEPEGWQLVTLNAMPLVVQIAAISAMSELNKPLPDDIKLTNKHSGLELDNNDYIHSLKVIILLMVFCQLSAIFSDLLLWSVVFILPLWCIQLSSRMARSEFEKHAPSPKKQWVKLNMNKSPKVSSTPTRSTAQGSARKSERDSDSVRATPRTRTRRAVRSFVSGVSDKYHAFEQNVAHQISTKIFNPISPRAKAIES